MSRLAVEWVLRDGNGRGTLRLLWGSRRRHIADIWVNRWSRDRADMRDNVTWSTWDSRGTGGENSSDCDIATAIESVLVALLRQAFIPSLSSTEVQPAFDAAGRATATWCSERGLPGIRWFP